MSAKAMGWALDQTTELPVDKLVLIALGNFADESHQCYPGRKTLARMAMCSVDTVDRSIARLCAANLVQKECRQHVKGGAASNAYTLAVVDGADATHHGSRTPGRKLRPPSRTVPAAANCGEGVGAKSPPGWPHPDAARVAAQDAATKEPSKEPSKEGGCEAREPSVTSSEVEIKHRAFVISLPAIEMATLRSGLPKPEVKTRCLAHALQWAAEIDAGKLPRDVLPTKIANFLAASIMGEVNRDQRSPRRDTARPGAPPRKTLADVLRASAEARQMEPVGVIQ